MGILGKKMYEVMPPCAGPRTGVSRPYSNLCMVTRVLDLCGEMVHPSASVGLLGGSFPHCGTHPGRGILSPYYIWDDLTCLPNLFTPYHGCTYATAQSYFSASTSSAQGDLTV